MNHDLREITGETLAGKYELERRLGSGAMGQVWIARHQLLNEHVAIKVLPEKVADTALFLRERFLFEAQATARLSRKSKHIVRVSDYGVGEGMAYLVMELLEGIPLNERLAHEKTLTLDATSAIVTQIAKGLSTAHADGVLHRDLKPSNVFITRDENGREIAKLLDFGIARSLRPERSPVATIEGMLLGTPDYMSPEQSRGAPVDHRADVWALAVTTYELVTGTTPFAGDSVDTIFLALNAFEWKKPSEHRKDLPPALDTFFVRAFSPALQQRFQTPEDLASALRRIARDARALRNGNSTTPPPPSVDEPSLPITTVPPSSSPPDERTLPSAGVPRETNTASTTRTQRSSMRWENARPIAWAIAIFSAFVIAALVAVSESRESGTLAPRSARTPSSIAPRRALFSAPAAKATQVVEEAAAPPAAAPAPVAPPRSDMAKHEAATSPASSPMKSVSIRDKSEIF